MITRFKGTVHPKLKLFFISSLFTYCYSYDYFYPGGTRNNNIFKEELNTFLFYGSGWGLETAVVPIYFNLKNEK